VLAACGVVFATASPAVRAQLEALGVLVVTEPGEVSDLRGYALSVESTRRLTILGDPALRRTALTGDGTLPLPAVTAVVSSRRPDDVDACLGYLVTQTYPEFEVVLGTHGYQLGRDVVDRWSAALPVPLRVVPVPAEQTLGTALGRLSRMADGELITKVDDDDHYGPHHVTDLVLSLHTSGADLVAKGARFVHLPELGKTIDRIWAAPEVFNVTVAGGTMLIARSTLQQVGGWSASSRHVDSDLISRVRAGGGLTYRTHALEYVYVRRAAGHTWTTKIDDLVDQGGRVYDDLPAEIVRPDPAV